MSVRVTMVTKVDRRGEDQKPVTSGDELGDWIWLNRSKKESVSFGRVKQVPWSTRLCTLQHPFSVASRSSSTEYPSGIHTLREFTV